MTGVIKAENRFCAQNDWLTSYHLFSFSEYYDPQNISFGSLRVFNDDLIKSGNGFAPHSHREMEILTIMLSGTLLHEDSLGNSLALHRGDIQRMTAGTGIVHSEFAGLESDTRLFQLWFLPSEKNRPPSYEDKNFQSSFDVPGLTCVAAFDGREHALALNSPAVVYRGYLPAEMTIEHTVRAGQGIFIYVFEGHVTVDKQILLCGDQMRQIADGEPLTIRAHENSRMILIDLLSL